MVRISFNSLLIEIFLERLKPKVMELEVLEIDPQVLEKLRKLQKSRGRKSLITKILNRDPKILVKILYLIEIENRSFGEVISYLKNEGFSISKGGLFNLLQQLKKANVYMALFKSAEKVKRRSNKKRLKGDKPHHHSVED